MCLFLIVIHYKICFSWHIRFCDNTAREQSHERWESKRTVAAALWNWDEIIFFPLLRKGAIIMASFYSPVEAPAPDSAMNHGWLMGISHTHPIDTHTHTHTQIQTRGIPIAWGRKCCYSRLSHISWHFSLLPAKYSLITGYLEYCVVHLISLVT